MSRFAGGSGITPIISLIRTALASEPDSRFTLFYGNRDSASVIFLEALADLKDRYMGRFELYHFLAEEEQDIELFNGMLDRGDMRRGDRRSWSAIRPRSTTGSSAAPAR